MKLNPTDQAELDRLMVEFDAAGGRGVELADRIDELTRRRDWDDRFDSLSDDERCQVCGQPDNCGDCDHTPLPADQAALLLDMEDY